MVYIGKKDETLNNLPRKKIPYSREGSGTSEGGRYRKKKYIKDNISLRGYLRLPNKFPQLGIFCSCGNLFISPDGVDSHVRRVKNKKCTLYIVTDVQQDTVNEGSEEF